jgi:molybdopterin-guanine dinucleotide biosynthesis protein A
MILITSAQYVDEEFISEFGKIPPSFLPVGNKRLYEHQAGLFTSLNEPVYISLPADYEIPYQDKIRLQSLNLKPIFIPTNKSLGESVAYALITTLGDYAVVRLLHGDTLFDELPVNDGNSFAIGNSSENYNWATYSLDSKGRAQFHSVQNDSSDVDIISGYFSFDQPLALLKALTNCNGQFLAALNQYAQEFDMKPWTAKMWLDFGHMNTYHRSKSTVTTQRAFNEMSISPRVVSKASTNNFKMASESHWFENIPPDLKIYTPHYLKQTHNGEFSGYDIEYLYLPVLNELFVFGDLPFRTWKTILRACEEFMLIAGRHQPNEVPNINSLYDEKLWQRLNSYCQIQNMDIAQTWNLNGQILPSLEEVAKNCLAKIKLSNSRVSVVHGDFCFSNILYDFRLQAVRCIDPRGHLEDNITMYGDARYDLAKLCHSIIGGYDHIIAGNFSWQSNASYEVEFELFTDPVADKIESYLLENGFANLDLIKDGIYAIMITLFLSMLPLHNDKPQRQRAFLANALRLYAKLEEISSCS